jgi:hypothetical protein
MTIKRRKKIAIAKNQFTFAGILYRVESEFKGTKKQADALIIKNLLKWQ